MPFIKLTGATEGEQFGMNVDQIVTFFEVTAVTRRLNEDRGLSPEANCVVQVLGSSVEVRENFDQVMRKIEKAGQPS